MSTSIQQGAGACLAHLVRCFATRRGRLLERRDRQRGRAPQPRATTSWVRVADWSCVARGPQARAIVESLAAVAPGQPLVADFVGGADPMRGPAMRPRGLAAEVASVQGEGGALPAALLDLSLYLYHHAETLVRRGGLPCVVLPPTESLEEALWFADVLEEAEWWLELPAHSVAVVASIESERAAAEVHEILFALRRRVLALHADIDGPQALEALAAAVERRGVVGLGRALASALHG